MTGRYLWNKILRTFLPILLLIIFGSVGCNLQDVCNSREILRLSSPDNLVDAVLVESDCGATTSLSYKVYLVPAQKSIKGCTPIFISDKVESLEIKWTNIKNLSIKYSRARIFSFRNFWNSKDVKNFRYTVWIQEFQINPINGK